MPQSFYWHDYETWGSNPAQDRPVQFAGLRTDWELNIVGPPLLLYAKPANDVLPQPQACLITGITPQLATREGINEAEFIGKIHTELAQPETCGVGYNSLRFDDEVTRYTLFRNFFEPYGREWQNGNSRWDLIDVMRLAHALRPEGLEWPQVNGCTSFRLTDLTAANNISHVGAHDALADVRATIDLARLLRSQQPKLFEFALGLRHKLRIKNMLGLPTPQPILHVSSKYPAIQGCIAPVLALTNHPVDHNGVLVVDLRTDPQLFADLSVAAMQQRIFTRREELGDTPRLPVKILHINRVPMLAPLSTLTAQTAERWDINLTQVHAHAAYWQASPAVIAKLQQAFMPPQYPARDPEQDLYGAFISNDDLAKCVLVRSSSPEALRHLPIHFRDTRLQSILLRYRARNWPHTLTAAEQAQWEAYRRRRLTDPQGGGSITLEQYHTSIAELRVVHAHDAKVLALLDAMAAWAAFIL